jgi:hypothetical protein
VSRSPVILSGEAPEKKERRKAAKRSVAQRSRYVADRKAISAERDAQRVELARTASPAIRIPQERGYLRVEPGTLPLADEVIRAANQTIDSVGHDGLLEARSRRSKPYLVDRFIGFESIPLDSPYFRFALSDEVFDAVSAYLGVVPVLYDFDVWYTIPSDEGPRGSQKWHLDHDDASQMKVWLYCSDLGPDSGPLTVLDAEQTSRLADEIGYDMGEEYRIPDEKLAAYEQAGTMTALTGEAGTVYFTDTSRCFHMGGRLAPGATPRRTAHFQFVTPYSFTFGDHRQEARFRHLADDAPDERTRMVLGAV